MFQIILIMKLKKLLVAGGLWKLLKNLAQKLIFIFNCL